MISILLKRKRALPRLTAIFFIVLNILPFLNMLQISFDLRSQIIANIFLGCLSFALLPRIQGLSLKKIDFLIAAYIYVCIISGICFFLPSNPYDNVSYFSGIHTIVFPVICYLFMKNLESSDQDNLLKYILVLNFIACILGLLLFYFVPAFYLKYLLTLSKNTDNSHELFITYGRLHSYFGSQIIAIIAPISIVLLSMSAIWNGFPFNKYYIRVIALIVFASTGVLTMQRAGYINIAIAIIAYFTLFKTNKTSKMKMIEIILFIFFFSFLFLIFTEKYSYIHTEGFNKLYKISEALPSRWDSNYQRAFDLVTDYPFGVGLGATTVKAKCNLSINDANFMRVLADTGIVGFIVMISIFIEIFRKTIRKKALSRFTFIFGFYVIHSLGANIIDAYYSSYLFWLFIGYIASYNRNHITGANYSCWKIII